MIDIYIGYSSLFIVLGAFFGFFYFKISTFSNNLAKSLYLVLCSLAFFCFFLQFVSDTSHRRNYIDWKVNFCIPMSRAKCTRNIDIALENTTKSYEFLMYKTSGSGFCSLNYNPDEDVSIFADRLRETISHLKLLKEKYPRLITDLGLVEIKDFYNYRYPNLEVYNSVFLKIGINGAFIFCGLTILVLTGAGYLIYYEIS